MKYKFAYSTNAYTNFSSSEAIERISRLGFDGVEILADAPHILPNKIKDCEIDALKSVIESYSLAISNINANTAEGLESIISQDSTNRRKRIDYIKRCIYIANKLCSKNISISVEQKSSTCSYSETYDILLASLKEILTSAEQYNIKIGIEYEPGFYIDNADKLLRIIADISHPLLGANLDIGHSAVAGDDIGLTIEQLGNKIWNIHLEDIKRGVHNHLIPGEGDINFRSLKTALDRVGYNSFITLELYPYKNNPDEAGRKGLEYIRNIFC